MSASLSGLVSSINSNISKLSARIDTAHSLAEAAMKRPVPEPVKDPEVHRLRDELTTALSTIRDLQTRLTALEAKQKETDAPQ